MPKTFLEFGEWVPDGGPVNNSGMWFVKNALKVNDNYEPMPALTKLATGPNSGADAPLGIHYHIKRADKNALIFYGSAASLYVGETDDGTGGVTWYDASGASAPYTSTRWRFASFGPTVIATNGVDPVQGYTVADTFDSAANFADLLVTTSPTTADILPKHVCVFKNHVFAANITMAADWPAASPQFSNGTLYPELVWWSDTDNATRFGDIDNTPQLKNSGWFLLYDGNGEITGFAVASDTMYLFKERAIYRCDGSPFTFTPVSLGTGCQKPESICNLNDEVFFWSDIGPHKITSSGEVVQLGNDTCYRTIGESFTLVPTIYTTGFKMSCQFTPSNELVWAVPDPVNGLVAFFSTTADSDFNRADGNLGNGVLVYNARTDNLYYGEASCSNSQFAPINSVGYPIRRRASTSSLLSGVVVVGEDAGGEYNLYRSFDVKFHTGGILYFRLPFVRLGEGSSRITKIRPVLSSGDQPTNLIKYTISVLTTDNPSSSVDPPEVVIERVAPSSSGWVDCSGCKEGVFHSVGLGILNSSGTDLGVVINDISGIEIEFAASGIRSR